MKTGVYLRIRLLVNFLKISEFGLYLYTGLFLKFTMSKAVSEKDKIDNLNKVMKHKCLSYGTWIIQNCIVARDGFRIGTSNWSKVISNEDAYEMYLESLKNVTK